MCEESGFEGTVGSFLVQEENAVFSCVENLMVGSVLGIREQIHVS